MNDLLKEVIETNLQIQREAQDLNIRAGERIFPTMSRSEWKTWLTERLQGVRSVAEITDLDSLYLPLLDPDMIEKIMAENPDTLEVGGEALEIKYEQDWCNRFICSAEISEAFARCIRTDKISLPSGRIVRLECGRYSADSIPELVEMLEKSRIEKAWEEKRREKERNSWMRNPEDVIPYLSQLGPVEITRRDNGEGEQILGYLSLYSDSCPDFLIKLRENREEAEKETGVAIERLLKKNCGNIFAVPEEEPWQYRPSYSWYKRPAGEILEQKLREITASVLDGLSSENYSEKVVWAKNEIETVKSSLREGYIALEDFLSQKEREIEEMIYSISYDYFVKSEISQVREEMERAKQLLGEMKYREARAACHQALELVEPLDFLSRNRRGEYDRANDKWRPVAEVLYSLSEAHGMFREATEEEKEQAEKTMDEVNKALDNNNFDFVVKRALEVNSWVKNISAQCSEREQNRRENYPEGVWEAVCGCASDDPDEIAEKGIELVKACLDLAGDKSTLYFLRLLIKGNRSKHEKQRKLLELVSGLEETEIGEWFNSLHYADDIDAAIRVGIAYLESKSVEMDKLNLQLAQLLAERNEYPQEVADAEIEVQDGEAAYGVFVEGNNPKTGERQWEIEIKSKEGETIKCVVDRFAKIEIVLGVEYYFRYRNILVDNPSKRFKIVVVYPFLVKNRDFEKETSELKTEIFKEEKKEKGGKEKKVEDLASQLAAVFGANVTIKTKNKL